VSDVTLLDQWRLVLTIICDPRLSRGDAAVAAIIRFFKGKGGNSRASLDLLADKAGIARRNVIVSLKKLKSLGSLEVLSKGRRGRATEYLPAFKLGRRTDNQHNQSEKCGDAGISSADEKCSDDGITLNAEKVMLTSPKMANTVILASPPPTYGSRLTSPADE
jgi:biotin operon repressor